MADPQDYRAVLNLQAALLAISVAGGFNFNVAATAVKLDPDHAAEQNAAADGVRPLLLIVPPVDQAETWEFQPARRVRVTHSFEIHWVGDSVVTEDASRIHNFYLACQDIERAITQDISRGGVAADTRITGRRFDTSTEVRADRVWAVVTVQIVIHRQYGQA